MLRMLPAWMLAGLGEGEPNKESRNHAPGLWLDKALSLPCELLFLSHGLQKAAAIATACQRIGIGESLIFADSAHQRLEDQTRDEQALEKQHDHSVEALVERGQPALRRFFGHLQVLLDMRELRVKLPGEGRIEELALIAFQVRSERPVPGWVLSAIEQ